MYIYVHNLCKIHEKKTLVAIHHSVPDSLAELRHEIGVDPGSRLLRLLVVDDSLYFGLLVLDVGAILLLLGPHLILHPAPEGGVPANPRSILRAHPGPSILQQGLGPLFGVVDGLLLNAEDLFSPPIHLGLELGAEAVGASLTAFAFLSARFHLSFLRPFRRSINEQ